MDSEPYASLMVQTRLSSPDDVKRIVAMHFSGLEIMEFTAAPIVTSQYRMIGEEVAITCHDPFGLYKSRFPSLPTCNNRNDHIYRLQILGNREEAHAEFDKLFTLN